MKVLVACEYSGRVRDAFRAAGHDAMSCDFLPTEAEGPHYQGDLRDVLDERWDLLIAHPHCTYNNLAGIRWMYHPDDTHLPAEQRRRHPDHPERMDKFLRGVELFNLLKNATHIPKRCIENSQPHGLAMQHVGRYTQIVQPWMFGDPYTKAAALWLVGLPLLKATHKKSDYSVIHAACHKAPPGPDRWRERSRTYPSVARAMAEQWGNLT